MMEETTTEIDAKDQERVSLVPEINPERLANNAMLQAELAKKGFDPFAHLSNSTDGGTAAFAAQITQDRLRMVELLSRQRHDSTDENEREDLRQVIHRYQDEAASALISLGMFLAAAEIAHSEDIQTLALDYQSALDLPSNKWCRHDKFANKDGVITNNYYREFTFQSDKYGETAMLCCNLCGFRNAANLPNDLRKLSEVRAHAQILLKDVHPLNHDRVLSDANLTQETLGQLIK